MKLYSRKTHNTLNVHARAYVSSLKSFMLQRLSESKLHCNECLLSTAFKSCLRSGRKDQSLAKFVALVVHVSCLLHGTVKYSVAQKWLAH